MTPELFISLLEVDKEKVREVLRPQIHPEILKFLVGGIFDDTQKRLIAYILMPVNKEYFWRYDYIFKFSQGHSALLFNLKPDEIRPTGIYPPEKNTLQEKIEDGYYRSNLISLACEYDFNEWNILTSNCFTNSKNKPQIIGNELNKVKSDIKNHLFGKSIFHETVEYYDKVMNRNGRLPKMDISTEMRPFVDHSYLVALIRCKKKREVNEAYIGYIEKAVSEPLMIKLKTLHPDEYMQIEPFSHIHHDLLFPEHKRFCLFICVSVDSFKKKRLRFFIYQQANNLVYEWTYFPESTYRKYKLAAHDLPIIFNPISKLDTWEYLINPECTFDDDEFWNNYVFKKENNEYVYLNELKFN